MASPQAPGTPPTSHKRTLSGHVQEDVRASVLTPTVAEFVRRYGGTTVIEKILIANNGIAVGRALFFVELRVAGCQVHSINSKVVLPAIWQRARHPGKSLILTIPSTLAYAASLW